jgi:hypothetical protein
MGTMSPEPEVLELAANRGGWAEVRVVACRVARPAMEDHRDGRRLAQPTDAGQVTGRRPPRTWPHLNSVGPGVEAGRPRTLGSKGAGGATATVAAATAIAVVAVILLLVRLLQLLRALLMLLLSWWVFLLIGGGRG